VEKCSAYKSQLGAPSNNPTPMFSLNLARTSQPQPVGALFGGRVDDLVLRPAPPHKEAADVARAALAGRLVAMRLLPADAANQVDTTDAARLVLILHVLNPWMRQELYRAHIGRIDELDALLLQRPELRAWGSAADTAGMLEPEFWSSWADFVALCDWTIAPDKQRVMLKRDYIALAARQTRVDRDTSDFARFTLDLEDVVLRDLRRAFPCATVGDVRRNALLLYVVARCLLDKNGRAVLARPRFDWLGDRGRDLVWQWLRRQQNRHLDEVRRDDRDYAQRVHPTQESLYHLLSMATIDLPTRQLVCPAPTECPPAPAGTTTMSAASPSPSPLADLRFAPSKGGSSAGPSGMTFVTPGAAASAAPASASAPSEPSGESSETPPEAPQNGESEAETPPPAREDVEPAESDELAAEEEGGDEEEVKEEADVEGEGDKGPKLAVPTIAPRGAAAAAAPAGAYAPAASRIGVAAHRCAYHDHATKRTDGFCAPQCVRQRLGRLIGANRPHALVAASVAVSRAPQAGTSPAQKIAGAMVVGALTAKRPNTRAALFRAYRLPTSAADSQPATPTAWRDLSFAVERVGASAQLPDDVDALARRGGWADAAPSERLSRYVVCYATGKQRDAVWQLRGWKMTPAIGAQLDEWTRARPLVPVRTVQAIAYAMH